MKLAFTVFVCNSDFYSDSDTDGDPLSPTAATGKVSTAAKSDHRHGGATVSSSGCSGGFETRTVASSVGPSISVIPAARSALPLPPPPALM